MIIKSGGFSIIQTFSWASIFYIIIFCSLLAPAYPEIKTNDTAPRINLRDMDNKLVFVSDELKKKPILISFFFTGCLPCKKELPELEKLYSRYGHKVGMYLISTDTEGSETVRPYISRMKITIPVLIDKYSDVAKLYGIDKYPSMLLIGKNGKVTFVSYGYNEQNIIKLEEALKKRK